MAVRFNAELLEELLKRRAEIEQAVFNSPPADYSDFACRLGSWREVNRLIEMQKAAAAADEQEEDRL